MNGRENCSAIGNKIADSLVTEGLGRRSHLKQEQGKTAMKSDRFSLGSKISAFQVMSFSLSAVIVLSHSSAIAQTSSPGEVSQTNPRRPDVIIDTESNSGNSPSLPGEQAQSDTRFRCEYTNGQYQVMYHPEDQYGDGYPWAVPSAMGGGWTAEKRCAAISARLESYRPDGLLELRTGIENNYNVVCATTQEDSRCRIVFTVPPGQDPVITRDRVFENLTVADSGQMTQGVTTYVEGNESSSIFTELDRLLGGNGAISDVLGQRQHSDALYLRPFLSPTDGGTGERLSGGMVRPASGSPLNPDRFR
ncbi:MAG: COP23 domain-containing protein [Cyanobacteriota bacterium]|nr:COP23 domain-containing protein [Cyanobacteriota bacterium]